MAMDSLEANSRKQTRILGGEGQINSTAMDQTLNLGLNNKPKKIMLDEVCGSKKVHQFYFVKFWPYKDPDEASKISDAQQLIEKLDQKLSRMRQQYKLSTSKWIDTHKQLFHLNDRESSIRYELESQKRMLDHLQVVLDKLNVAQIAQKHKGGANNTQGFQSSMLHGSSNLAKEKKLLREIARSQQRLSDLDPSSLLEQHIRWFSWGNIDKARYSQMLEKMKQIEERKKKALADTAENGKILNPLSLRNAIEEQIKIVNKISSELREEQREVISAIVRLKKDLKPMREEEFVHRTQRWEMLKQKEAAQKCIFKLRQTFDEMNGMYRQYLSLLSNARELARNNDVAALRKLSHDQVEEFMSEWSHAYVKTFRINYEFSILPSLRKRQLSQDGRIENCDQETLQYIEDGSDICYSGSNPGEC